MYTPSTQCMYMYMYSSIHGPGQGNVQRCLGYGTASEPGAWSLEPVTAGCASASDDCNRCCQWRQSASFWLLLLLRVLPVLLLLLLLLGSDLASPSPSPSPMSNNDIEFCGRKVGRIYLVTVLLYSTLYVYTMIMAPSLPMAETLDDAVRPSPTKPSFAS